MIEWLSDRKRGVIAVSFVLLLVIAFFSTLGPLPTKPSKIESTLVRGGETTTELFGVRCILSPVLNTMNQETRILTRSGADVRDVGPSSPWDFIDLGEDFIELGRFGDAEVALLKAIEEVEKRDSNGPFAKRAAEELLAILYSYLGRSDEARERFTRIVEDIKQQEGENSESYWVALQNVGWIEAQLGHYEDAETKLAKAHEALARIGGGITGSKFAAGESLAELYILTERFELARSLLEETTANYTCPQSASLLRALDSFEMLAQAYEKTGNSEKANDLTTEIFRIRNRVITNDHPDLASSYEAISDLVSFDPAASSSAIYFLKFAVNNLQGVRQNMADASSLSRESFSEKWSGTYLKLQSLLINQGRFAEAEQVGRMLKEVEYTAFVRGASDAAPGEELALTAQEREWQAQLEGWMSTPNQLARERSALAEKKRSGELSEIEEQQLADLNEAHGKAYEDFFAQVASWTADVQEIDNAQVAEEARALALEQSRSVRRTVREIGDDVALLQAVAFEDSLHLFLITGDAFEHTQVNVTRSELFATIFEARETIDLAKYYDLAGDKTRKGELQRPLGKLHEWLIAPIEDELAAAGTKTLMLNLQGQIRFAPFAALWDGEAYLTQKYRLAFYTPAANTRYDKPAQLTRAQGFGLSKKTEGFSPLPSVPLELEYIIGSADKPGVIEGQYQLNETFTQASFEEGLTDPAPVVHLATHFQIRPGDEAASYLVLGDGSRVSIAAINRSYQYSFEGVELLTLSACETAIGAESTGLELEGFAALAQNKGASSVVATLWQVDDGSTPEFMRSFYSGIVRDNLSKAEALRRAQIKMINSVEHSDPFYWAPFVIMGNWR